MSTSRLLIALFLAASPVVVQGQNDSYWLIGQVVGRWEYREAGGRPRPLSGKYDCLLPAGEVRCLEADARNCQLRYLSSPRSKATTKLPIQATRQWISLRRLPAPPPAILPTTSAALARTFTRYTRPGGSRA